jgi:hypothetical protein
MIFRDPEDSFSTTPDEIKAHAIEFAPMMFAHASFEFEVQRLQGAITDDPSFGERRKGQMKSCEGGGAGQEDSKFEFERKSIPLMPRSSRARPRRYGQTILCLAVPANPLLLIA